MKNVKKYIDFETASAETQFLPFMRVVQYFGITT